MHKHTHTYIHAHTNEHTRALTLEHKSVCVCVCVRIVKTKVTTRIITTAKKCNNQEKIQTQKQKKMCMLTGSSKTTGDENEMKTGAKLSSLSAVGRLSLPWRQRWRRRRRRRRRHLRYVAFNKLQLRLQLQHCSINVFLPISENI